MLNGNIGQYSIQATLNAYVKTGTSNDTIGTAQDIYGHAPTGSAPAVPIGWAWWAACRAM